MMAKSYEEIVEKIVEGSDLSKEDVEAKIKEKIDQLGSLVSKEGAAHIIANQVGVKVFEEISKKDLKIKSLIGGIGTVDLNVKVLNVYEVKTFVRKDKEARVVSLLVGDESGSCRLVVWDEKYIDVVAGLKEGDILRLKNLYSKDNNSYIEVHLGGKGSLDVNPEGVSVEIGSFKRDFVRKNISEFKEREYVEVFGSVVQVFEPRFFVACPECRKKVEVSGEGFVCKEHGEVVGEKVPILNVFFDDGTESIRAVAFRDNVKGLVGSEVSEESNFEEIKDGLELRQVVLGGRVTKNDMFDRLEFTINSVGVVDPLELVKEIDV